MEMKFRERETLVESYSQHLHLHPRQYHRRHAATLQGVPKNNPLVSCSSSREKVHFWDTLYNCDVPAAGKVQDPGVR